MCVSPTFFWLDRGPRWEKIPKGCGKCWRCRANHVNGYVARALCEASTSDWSVTVTLTYADPDPSDQEQDQLAHLVITPSHFQNAIKRFRRRGYVVRYLAVGEYGDLRGRAHFHVALFGKGDPPAWPHKENHQDEKFWPHGHIFADWSADEKAMRYVCKYLLKNEPGRYWFSLSKKPALGAEWFARKAAEAVELGVLPSTFEFLPPGGDRGRPYLMTGATRRDYLQAVVDGWQNKRPLERSRLSEWVGRILDAQLLRQAKLHAEANYTLEDFMADFYEEKEPERPTERQINAQWLKGHLDADAVDRLIMDLRRRNPDG